MALARKCDVCGVLYEEYKDSNERIGLCSGRDWMGHRCIDLCPDCFTSIRNHIKELKDRNKEKENA